MSDMPMIDKLHYKINLDDAVQAYLNLRDEKARIEAEAEARVAEVERNMAEIDQILLSVCQETNANSINTNHGTIIRQIKERFVCSDWDGFRRFELENPEYDFREKRIHQGNFKTYMEHHDGEGMPPGVNSMREFQIVVRRSNK